MKMAIAEHENGTPILRSSPALTCRFAKPTTVGAPQARLRPSIRSTGLIHFELNIGEIPDAVSLLRLWSSCHANPVPNTLHTPQPSLGDSLVVPHRRPQEVVAFERQIVDFFVSAADVLGVPKSVAAIYGIVFASPLPLSFADIEERLDISKGSISQGLRFLREVGALKEVSGPMDRAELFVPDLELRKVISRFIEGRLGRQLQAGSSRLAALNKAVPGGSRESAAELRRRLKSLTDWHVKANSVLPVVRGILKVTG